MSKERTIISQALCDHVKLLVAGGANAETAAEITKTGKATIYRIKAAGYNAEAYRMNMDKQRAREAQSLVQEEKKPPEPERTEVPGQMCMELPEKETGMSEQVKMMRFQAAQVEKLYLMLSRINDNLCQILRRFDRT